MANPYAPAPTPYGPYGAAPAPGGVGALPPHIMVTVQSLQTWSKVFGIASIVFGAMYCLSLVGILIGWLPILLGVWVKNAGQELGTYAMGGDVNALNSALGKLRNYFLVTGIGMMITCVMVLLVILFYLLMLLGMFSLFGLGVAGAAAAGP
jgi:hypothetical protein